MLVFWLVPLLSISRLLLAFLMTSAQIWIFFFGFIHVHSSFSHLVNPLTRTVVDGLVLADFGQCLNCTGCFDFLLAVMGWATQMRISYWTMEQVLGMLQKVWTFLWNGGDLNENDDIEKRLKPLKCINIFKIWMVWYVSFYVNLLVFPHNSTQPQKKTPKDSHSPRTIWSSLDGDFHQPRSFRSWGRVLRSSRGVGCRVFWCFQVGGNYPLSAAKVGDEKQAVGLKLHFETYVNHV